MDRIVLITGGSRGIGFAIAQAFVAAGMAVVITARHAKPLGEAVSALERVVPAGKRRPASHPYVASAIADVTDQHAVETLVDQVMKLHGRIDILVNNAGRGGSGPTASSDPQLWYDVIDTNLHGVYRVTRAVLLKGGMVERKWGRIINIASIGGKVGVPFAAAYTASKHAVLGLTKALALELAKTGVTVNAICPGFVDTELAREAMARHGQLRGVSAEEAWRRYEAMVPVGRWITAEEVAPLAVYLASDLAAPVLGQAFNVCGGLGSY